MTTIDLISKLTDNNLFTLTTDKIDKWFEWLENETNYINGNVYLNTNKPVFHKQKYKQLIFDNAPTNKVECQVIITGDNFVQDQISQVQSDGTTGMVYTENITGGLSNLTSTVTLLTGTKGLSVKFANTSNSTYTLRIPPYIKYENNNPIPTDVYTGCIVTFTTKKQTLTLSNWSKNGNNISFHLTVGTPVENQSVIVENIDRNNNINATESSSLVNGACDFSFSIADDVEKLRILLKPIKKDNIWYLGKELTYSKNGEEIV